MNSVRYFLDLCQNTTYHRMQRVMEIKRDTEKHLWGVNLLHRLFSMNF